METKHTNETGNKIRVMWLSINASLFDVENTSGGWTSSLEKALKDYHGKEIDLAVVFEEKTSDRTNEKPSESRPVKSFKNDTAYYQISNRNDIPHKGIRRPDAFAKWEYIKPEIQFAIEDFKPDVIQCFGSEWPYGMIADSVDIPVVIHIQGFLNIYKLTEHLADTNSVLERPLYELIIEKLKSARRKIIYRNHKDILLKLERQIMSQNQYFMGRTNWDKEIVRFFSPGSKYYYINEVMRPVFYESAGMWEGGCSSRKLQLLTVSSASLLKGNEIILHTAQIMRDLLGVDFEWRVAGDFEVMRTSEKRCGIKTEDVNIKMLGLIPAQQIVDELRKADFFIHPSIIDNSANAVIEAQLMGCPVIASDVGGIPTIVKDNITGFLYPYNEPHTLAFKIADLMHQKGLVAAVSRNQVQEALRRNNPHSIADEVYKAYIEIISDYKHRT